MLGDFSFILKQQQVHNPTPTPPCPNPIGVYSNSYQISIPVWAKKEVRRAAPICTRELMEWVCWWGGMKCQPSLFPLGGQQKRFHKGSSWLALSQMGLPGGKTHTPFNPFLLPLTHIFGTSPVQHARQPQCRASFKGFLPVPPST